MRAGGSTRWRGRPARSRRDRGRRARGRGGPALRLAQAARRPRRRAAAAARDRRDAGGTWLGPGRGRPRRVRRGDRGGGEVRERRAGGLRGVGRGDGGVAALRGGRGRRRRLGGRDARRHARGDPRGDRGGDRGLLRGRRRGAGGVRRSVRPPGRAVAFAARSGSGTAGRRRRARVAARRAGTPGRGAAPRAPRRRGHPRGAGGDPMKLEQSFTVEAPIDEVWAAMIDVERIAPCLPGAEIAGVDATGGYEGTFTAKLGPTTASYRGSLRMEAVDEAARTATMSARGTDRRGQGSASATIVAAMREEGGATAVEVVTDFSITGRLARFGRSGMIEDISRRLMREFAECLQAMIAGSGAGSGAAGAPGAAGRSDSGSPGGGPVPPDDAGGEPAVGAPAGEAASSAFTRPRGGDGAAPGAPTPVRAGDVPAEAAGGAAPSGDAAAKGTLGGPPAAGAGGEGHARRPPAVRAGAPGRGSDRRRGRSRRRPRERRRRAHARPRRRRA